MTPNKYATLLLLLFITLFASKAGADDTQKYNEANKLFANGSYIEAIEKYDSITTVNPDLEYNRGAAYLKLGNIGKAALHFHRAAKLRPGDEDTLANIEYTRSIKVDKEPEISAGWLARAGVYLINYFSLDRMTLTAIIIYFVLTTLIASLIISQSARWKSVLSKSIIVATLFAVVWSTMTGVRIYKYEKESAAIVISEETDVYSNPSRDAEKVLTIHAGSELKTGRVDGNYVYITLASGYSGWAERLSIERI